MQVSLAHARLSAVVLLAAVPSPALADNCAADLDQNGAVDAVDLARILDDWGPCFGKCSSDINGDGTVGAPDLAALLAAWGPCGLPWATVLEQAPNPAVVTDPALRAAIAASGLPWRVRHDATQIEMLLVPAGTFEMGCTPGSIHTCSFYEQPVHAVTLSQPFYLGRYEVTQAQWTALTGSNPSEFQDASAEVPASQVPSRPVEQVSWDMIQSVLKTTDLRLPTEAEWEYAYRAGTTTAYHSMPGFPNGTSDYNQLVNIAWNFIVGSVNCTTGSACQTRPVGLLAANALGFHDMSGNVSEWVYDFFALDYYAQSPLVDPVGPAEGFGGYRTRRGGSWGYAPGFERASARDFGNPSQGYNFVGLRVVRSVDGTP